MCAHTHFFLFAIVGGLNWDIFPLPSLASERSSRVPLPQAWNLSRIRSLLGSIDINMGMGTT